MTANSRLGELNFVDEPGVAHTLRVMLLVVLGSALAISAFTLFLRWQLTPQLALVAAASSVVALALSRSGRMKPAMMLLLLSITYAVVHSAVRTDGIQSIGLAILPVLIVVGSLVLDRRTMSFFAAGIILAVVGMLAIRYLVLRAERYSTNDMGDLFIFAVTCATAAMVGRLFASRIKDGFSRARVYCQALGLAERNVRLVADSLSEMVVVYDANRNLTYANSGAEKLTGYGLAELQVAAPLLWAHPEDQPRVLALWEKVFDGQTVDQIVHRLMTKNGKVRWVAGSWAPVSDEAGRHIGIRGTCQDITERVVVEQLLEELVKETTQKFQTIVEEISERKRAEQALRESEERLRANEVRLRDAQRLAKVGSWELDIEADRTYWSDEMLRILGHPDGAPSNFTAFLSCVHPKDRDKILEADRKVRSGSTPVEVEYRIVWPERELRFVRSSSSTPVDVEYRIVRPEGEVRFLRSIAEAIRNDHGAVVRIAGATQDITEQVKARDLLRESEERLKNAERLAHVGNWHWDLKRNQVIWSEECLRIFGQPQGYIPSYEDFLEAVVPQDRERVERWVREGLAERTGQLIEFQIARPNGELRTLTCTSEVSLDEQDVPARMFGACRDITDLRRPTA